uniref:FAD-dependent oxidoreductase domain-containing protein 1 n=1 Tax=Cucumis melo TaxID=3656 RepID=A0A9I9E5V6_CUCME
MNEFIVARIWERASEFFPTLKEVSLSDIKHSSKVRIGLRPYMLDGKPVIGPVPGLSNVFLASGHEGGGLSLAMGTAEMIGNMVLGSPGKNNAAFSGLGLHVNQPLFPLPKSQHVVEGHQYRRNPQKSINFMRLHHIDMLFGIPLPRIPPFGLKFDVSGNKSLYGILAGPLLFLRLGSRFLSSILFSIFLSSLLNSLKLCRAFALSVQLYDDLPSIFNCSFTGNELVTECGTIKRVAGVCILP